MTPTSTPFDLDDAQIDEISLVRKSADDGDDTHAVAWSSGDLAREAGAGPRDIPPAWRRVWNNAAAVMAGGLDPIAPAPLVGAGTPPDTTEPARIAAPGALSAWHDGRQGARVRLHGIWLSPEDSAAYLNDREGIGWT